MEGGSLTACLEKTAKQTTDIILYDQKVIVFKMESDVMLYVVGGPEENEVLLYRCAYMSPVELVSPRVLIQVQCCARIARFPQHPSEVSEHLYYITHALTSGRNSVDKRTVIENYDLVV
jgi:hypothetical protein